MYFKRICSALFSFIFVSQPLVLKSFHPIGYDINSFLSLDCKEDTIEKVYIERTRVVNFIKLGGGDLLCTFHRAEGLYGWVTCRGYRPDSILKT